MAAVDFAGQIITQQQLQPEQDKVPLERNRPDPEETMTPPLSMTEVPPEVAREGQEGGAMTPTDSAPSSPRAGKKLKRGSSSKNNKKKNKRSKSPRAGKKETTPSPPPTTLIKSVSFGHVQVRHYERVLDINPSVVNGPAIAIGWAFAQAKNVSVDSWEADRDDTLQGTPAVFTKEERVAMLKYWGYTNKDIATVTRNILKAKHARSVTVQNLNYQFMEEAMESMVRRLKRCVGAMFGRRTKAL